MRTLIAAIAVALFATAPATAGSLIDIAVIDRDTAGTGQTGYVLDAWQTTEIVGWRKSMDDVAQFNFTSLPNSYAARTGRPTNVGVIGVAVFTERAPVITYREPRRRADAQLPASAPPASQPYDSESYESEAKQEADARASTADAAAPMPKSAAGEGYAGRSESRQAPVVQEKSKRDQRLGTGHGSREDSRVVYTNFTRSSSRPAEQLGIWYDSYRNLVAQGVIVTRPIASNTPNPFPNSFVADPPR